MMGDSSEKKKKVRLFLIDYGVDIAEVESTETLREIRSRLGNKIALEHELGVILPKYFDIYSVRIDDITDGKKCKKPKGRGR